MVSATVDPRIGLCQACEHCRIVQTGRSTFYMCQRSFTQPEYPKYPRLPVVGCPGFEAPAARADDKLKG
jgi:hypothetical protein